MRDLESMLGDTTETLAAEAVINYRYRTQCLPTWTDLAAELLAFPGVEVEELAERIAIAWAAGEMSYRMNHEFDVLFEVQPVVEQRLLARYAYNRLMLANERASQEADRILSDPHISDPDAAADDFQEAYGRPVVDWLASDLEIGREHALRILLADKDEHSDAIPGEPFRLAVLLHRYVSDHPSG